jgi:hypothetical protein
MALLANIGDNDQVNIGIVCCQYPPDTIQFSGSPSVSLNVFIGGVNPLLSGQDALLTPTQGTWTCPTPPPPTGCPPQLRRLNSLVNLTVHANGKLITCVGDSTEQDGFTKRLITGPGITVGNVFIGGK